MNPRSVSLLLRQRLANGDEAENQQVAIRVAIVSTALVYFNSGYYASHASNLQYVNVAGWAATVAFVITMGILLAVLARPGISQGRRTVAMFHDVTAISVAMLLGEAGAAAVAAIYLWVTLGNGFRYGVKFLYASAALSLVGFAAVYLYSDYWHSQTMLSLNIMIMLAAIPPYVARLLSSLHKAKAQLAVRASFDGLTGLMNRSEFEKSIANFLSVGRAGHFLLYCDLDHFKAVNDEAGHAAGDKLLADVGKIIQECVRSDDFTARLGGDEFAVFLRNCPDTRAREIAENIRNSVSGYRLAWSTKYYRVGISVGAAPSSAVNDLSSLMRLADSACYAAKNAGRNQVHIVDVQDGFADTQTIRKLFADKVRKKVAEPRISADQRSREYD
jgi:diguanylate cyclase (GGDEF)-like protein